MAVRKVVTVPDYRLRLRSKPVREINDEIKTLARDMAETMYSSNGIGLAAIQVGVPLRLIVVDVSAGEEPDSLMTLINPVIVENSGKITTEEGCLSVPGVYGEVERFDKVVVEFMDLEGKHHAIEAEGLLAVAFQHEIDHTLGKLFVDYFPPKQKAKMLQKSKEFQRKQRLEQKRAESKKR